MFGADSVAVVVEGEYVEAFVFGYHAESYLCASGVECGVAYESAYHALNEVVVSGDVAFEGYVEGEFEVSGEVVGREVAFDLVDEVVHVDFFDGYHVGSVFEACHC